MTSRLYLGKHSRAIPPLSVAPRPVSLSLGVSPAAFHRPQVSVQGSWPCTSMLHNTPRIPVTFNLCGSLFSIYRPHDFTVSASHLVPGNDVNSEDT